MNKKSRLLYQQEHFSCYNYEKEQNARLEILNRPAGFILERNLIDTEIVFLIKGRFKLSYGKLVNKEITEGKMMLFPPGSHIVAEVIEDVHFIICRLRDVVQLCECMSLERLHKETECDSGDFYMLDMNDRINKFIAGFKKQFQKVFGTSASEWMSQQKATRVFQDLNNSPLSIKELAYKHDFSSVSAFSSFCKQKFGIPPGKIRLNIE